MPLHRQHAFLSKAPCTSGGTVPHLRGRQAALSQLAEPQCEGACTTAGNVVRAQLSASC